MYTQKMKPFKEVIKILFWGELIDTEKKEKDSLK